MLSSSSYELVYKRRCVEFSYSVCLSPASDSCCRAVCAENLAVEALLRNWSRCARKLVRLGVGRRPQQLQLLFVRSVPRSARRFSFRAARPRRPSSPSNQRQVSEHLLRSRRAIDIFGRRTTHRSRQNATRSTRNEHRPHARHPAIEHRIARPRQRRRGNHV